MGDTILSFCDLSGRWSQPWEDAGFDVVRVDLAGDPKHCHCGDVRLMELSSRLVHRVEGIMAAPPCTRLSKASSRFWGKPGDEERLLEALSIVDAIMRAVVIYRPRWWVLENPAGRLARFIGKAKFSFDPLDYAWQADQPASESYTKRTFLWGQGSELEPARSLEVSSSIPRKMD